MDFGGREAIFDAESGMSEQVDVGQMITYFVNCQTLFFEDCQSEIQGSP